MFGDNVAFIVGEGPKLEDEMRRWRLLSASVDCTLIMWDIMGTEIRTDPSKTFIDDEVDKMPIAELAV